LFAIVLGTIIGGVLFLIRLSYFNVDRVEVQGSETISKEEIIEIADEVSSGSKFFIIPRKQFFVYPKQEIREKILATYGQAKRVSIKREGFTGVLIAIQERTPTARYCREDCVLLDEEGYAYKTMSEGEFNLLPVIYAAESAEIKLETSPLDSQKFTDLLLFANKLSQLDFHLNEIRIEPNGSVRVILYEGDILISLDESLEEQFFSLQTVLNEVKDFTSIDLRYGKKVFYQTE
jgi:cell division septal protein FtsQ